MDNAFILLWVVILMAVIFDYVNGFHDAANAIATVVATGVLPVRTAVLLAGVMNFAGALAGTAVAKTIASGFADPAIVTQQVVLAALVGAIAWNLITWWYGIPSSSSHALIGGLAGAVVGHAGVGAFKWAALYDKVLKPLVLSPTIGFVAALILMIVIYWVVRNMRASKVNKASRWMQLGSAMTMAFSHGSNDAQKSMGIITLAIVAYMAGGHGALPQWMVPQSAGQVPYWVVMTCAAAIAVGTMAGGKRIIKTMGSKIFKITPLHGFAAETAGALTILGASHLGVPVSTTHCINACLMGVGTSKRVSAVKWTTAKSILVAWVVTLPLSGLMAYGSMKLIALMF